MIIYTGKKIDVNGCLGCAYGSGKFMIPCGMAYENDKFTLSQDWELPIEGFFVVSPKRHVETFSELSPSEKIEIFDIVDRTIKVLRENNVCDRFNVLFEEKNNRHFHIWIMPRHKWMSDLVGDIIDHVGEVFDYAKENMRTEECIERIKNITEIVYNEFNNRR